MDTTSLFPDLWVTTITADAVRAGCVEFLRRASEAAAPEEDGAVDFPDVEIAQQLSSEQLGQIPEDWLRGVRVKLTPDGSLFITRVETFQQREAREDVFFQVDAYKTGDFKLVAEYRTACTRLFLPDGSIVTPDVVIMEEFDTFERVPRVVCEVDVSPRSVAHMARSAAAYLTRDSRIARVLWLQFFPPSIEELADQSQRLRFAALAIVFRQSPTDQDRVEVVQMQSFGNAPVTLSFLKAFAEPSDDAPLVPYPSALRLATETSPHLPAHFDATTILKDVLDLRKTSASELWEVAMEAPLPVLNVNLKHVFLEAMLGWCRDQRQNNLTN